MNRREFTVDELRQAVACGPTLLLALLAEEQSRGHVEQGADGRWRLTRRAERDHGRHLRSMESP